jgi:hypothetical protein
MCWQPSRCGAAGPTGSCRRWCRRGLSGNDLAQAVGPACCTVHLLCMHMQTTLLNLTPQANSSLVPPPPPHPTPTHPPTYTTHNTSRCNGPDGHPRPQVDHACWPRWLPRHQRLAGRRILRVSDASLLPAVLHQPHGSLEWQRMSAPPPRRAPPLPPPPPHPPPPHPHTHTHTHTHHTPNTIFLPVLLAVTPTGCSSTPSVARCAPPGSSGPPATPKTSWPALASPRKSASR